MFRVSFSWKPSVQNFHNRNKSFRSLGNIKILQRKLHSFNITCHQDCQSVMVSCHKNIQFSPNWLQTQLLFRILTLSLWSDISFHIRNHFPLLDQKSNSWFCLQLGALQVFHFEPLDTDTPCPFYCYPSSAATAT